MQTLFEWITCVDRLLESNYAITLKDIGPSESDIHDNWNSGQAPTEYVKWIGRKYDLIHRKDWPTGTIL